MKKTMRGHVFLAVLLCGTMFLAACAKNGTGDTAVTPSENAPTVTEGATPSGEITPTAIPTATVTPTSAPTVTPTETPTPTPTIALGSAEQLRRNRELHELILPKASSAELGTGQALSELDKLDETYGIMRTNPTKYIPINLASGIQMDWNTHTYLQPGILQSVHVVGLTDDRVRDRINQRIDEVVLAMSDPCFIPDKAGVIALFRERGTPEINVTTSVSGGDNGFLSIYVHGNYMWRETRTFKTDEEYYEYRNAVSENPLLDVWDTVVQWADETGLCKVDFTYYVDDRVSLLFNLATGDEVAMSELFPEGMDYRTYLNDVVAGQLGDEYWFWMREEGPEMLYGDTYDPYGEYDAGGVFSGITAETGFSYDGIRQTVSLDIEDVAYTGGACLLPERIANPCRGGSVFLKPMGYRFSALEEIYLCETEYGYVLPNDLKKIGRIKVASGNTTQNVTVYMGDKGYPARGERTPAGEYHHVPAKDAVTEKELLSFVQDWATREWPRLEQLGFWSDCEKEFVFRSVVFEEADIYPNGYSFVTMTISDQKEWDNEEGWGMARTIYAWMKDGRFVSADELFDVSCEELLAELMMGFLDKPQGNAIFTPEQAADAAKILAEYVYWPLSPRNEADTEWKWDMFEFPWGTSAYSGWGTFPEELKDRLPAQLSNSILNDYEFHVNYYVSDPYCYEKHMRIYEGYPFEQ